MATRDRVKFFFAGVHALFPGADGTGFYFYQSLSWTGFRNFNIIKADLTRSSKYSTFVGSHC